MKNFSSTLFLVCVTAVVLAASAGVGLLRDYGCALFLKLNPPPIAQPCGKDAETWLHSVQEGNSRRALAVAGRLVPESVDFQMPPLRYLGLISDFKVRLAFLTDPFNKSDFARWQGLLAAQRVLKELPDTSLQTLLKAVMARIKDDPTQKYPPIDLMSSWDEGKGDYSLRLRVLCALAYQAGYECQIFGVFKKVGFLDQELGLFTRGNETWFADCVSGELISPERLKNLSSVQLVPAEPQDYRASDQLLYKRLTATGVKGLPRFPRDPFELRAKQGLATYWLMPFYALKSSPEFSGWLCE